MSVETLGALLRNGSRPRLSMDIDEVLGNTFENLLHVYNKANGTNFTIADNVSFDLQWMGLKSSAELIPYYINTWRSRHSDIKFLGNLRLLKALAGHYEIDLVTAGSHEHENLSSIDALRNWLKMHMLHEFPLVLCPPNTSKATLGYSVYVDDSPNLAKLIAGREDKVQLLVKGPWNKDYHRTDIKGIIPVDNVHHAVNLLIEAARREPRKLRAA
ncbi:MAG: hypothetical protein KGH64_01620 [Candidatus Micrarchaeota archaeon]|nr:hypothetical protein [Candidatus Micrarchaeota archaeon]MDE1834015.1 hypothetical protein [Candidatus Micrarchaeota archaeon]MDE1859476.1 hypothetical protein [Candidatus Micrarchaeota archaeon]